MRRRFDPELFHLDPNPLGLELDTEVAAHIANEVYAKNRPGHAGNNWAVESFRIDPTGRSGNRSPGYDEDSSGYVVSVLGDPSYFRRDNYHEINGDFAEATQAAFDIGERRNRMNVKGTFGFMGAVLVPSAVIEGGIAMTGDSAAMITAGAMLAVVNGLIDVSAVQNLYRRALTNPKYLTLHGRHLLRAYQIGIDLRLPPMLVKG